MLKTTKILIFFNFEIKKNFFQKNDQNFNIFKFKFKKIFFKKTSKILIFLNFEKKKFIKI